MPSRVTNSPPTTRRMSRAAATASTQDDAAAAATPAPAPSPAKKIKAASSKATKAAATKATKASASSKTAKTADKTTSKPTADTTTAAAPTWKRKAPASSDGDPQQAATKPKAGGGGRKTKAVKTDDSTSPGVTKSKSKRDSKPAAKSKPAPAAKSKPRNAVASSSKAPLATISAPAVPTGSTVKALTTTTNINNLLPPHRLFAIPHIFAAITDGAPLSTLLALRWVSKWCRVAVDAILASQLLIRWLDQAAELIQVVPRVFEVLPPCPTAWDTIDHWAAFAGDVRVLDLYGSVVPYIHPAIKQGFTNLKAVRVRAQPHEQAHYWYFNAPKLVVCGGLSYQNSWKMHGGRAVPPPLGTTEVVFNLQQWASEDSPPLFTYFKHYEMPETLRDIVIYIEKRWQKGPRSGPGMVFTQHGTLTHNLAEIIRTVLVVAYTEVGRGVGVIGDATDSDATMDATNGDAANPDTANGAPNQLTATHPGDDADPMFDPPMTFDTPAINPVRLTFVDVHPYVCSHQSGIVLNGTRGALLAAIKTDDKLKDVDLSFVRFMTIDEYRTSIGEAAWHVNGVVL